MNKEKQGKKLRFNLKSNPIMGVLIPLIFIMLVTQIFNHNFLTGANLSSILKSIPFLALATLGASFPLLIGEIDISVGRIAGLCGMFFSLLFVVYNLPLPVSILCALALGLVIGFVNAFLVVKIGMSSFIATMGTLYICGGLRYLVNGGTVMTLPTEMRNFRRQRRSASRGSSGSCLRFMRSSRFCRENCVRPLFLRSRQQCRCLTASGCECEAGQGCRLSDLRRSVCSCRCDGDDRY